MKRVRTNETISIGNSRKFSKKQEESDETHTFLPLDLIIEVLLKVPGRSLARFVIVSKQWLSIIRGKDFTKLYLTQSSTRPRLLFSVYRHLGPSKLFLQSFSQQDPSSGHHRLNVSMDPFHMYGFTPPVRGLICRQTDTKVMIGNPSTGQFLTLPRVKTNRRGLFSLFGYDPLNDVYKVLCMTVLRGHQNRGSRYVSEEHQVFTLGAKQKWRMLVCKYRHLPPPLTKGLCLNGILYYYAWIQNEGSLISFDLNSEDFNVIKLPHDIPCLVNYNGKIALTRQYSKFGPLDLWILEDARKQEWSKVSIVVPSWTDLVRNIFFMFRGTLSTGELIFAPVSKINPVYLISYDLKEDNAKQVEVGGGLVAGQNISLIVYLNHVESPMFLSK
ncbi:F-box domain [Arabidopsis suecica]|uniref:F-box domain n=1 Tax=Arabidopsis suecica TaxID=45249 RepID=A0A8T2B412_ARASU|nr:F-box domain [Arabidopsis suecica]